MYGMIIVKQDLQFLVIESSKMQGMRLYSYAEMFFNFHDTQNALKTTQI